MLLVDAKPTVAAVFCLLMLFCYKNWTFGVPSLCLCVFCVCVCVFFFVCVSVCFFFVCVSVCCFFVFVCVCVCQCMQCRLRFLRRNGKFRGWSSQRSLHSAPIFRLLLKVAVNGTHQCDSHNFWGALSSNKHSVTEDELLQAELGGSAASSTDPCCNIPLSCLSGCICLVAGFFGAEGLVHIQTPIFGSENIFQNFEVVSNSGFQCSSGPPKFL